MNFRGSENRFVRIGSDGSLRINIRVPGHTYRKIEQIAQESGSTISAVGAGLVEMGLEGYESETEEYKRKCDEYIERLKAIGMPENLAIDLVCMSKNLDELERDIKIMESSKQ